MSNLWLTVEARLGSDIEATCRDAVELAGKLGISVWFNFNGVKCLAKPSDDPALIAASWSREVLSSHQHKVASAGRA